jgi:hypothetical protein
MTKISLYVKEFFVNGSLARLGVSLGAWSRRGQDSSGQYEHCCRQAVRSTHQRAWNDGEAVLAFGFAHDV